MLLSDENEAYRKVVAEFVDREVAPYATEWDRTETMDRAIVGKLAALGAFGMTIPEEYGGSGGDHQAYVLMMEEFGRVDTSVRGIVSVSLGLVGKTILKHGTEEQKQEYLPRLCAGEILGCFGLTEPDTGSDAGSLKSKAVEDSGGWLISGTKIFITNGTWADFALIFARTGGPGPKGVTAFLVPTDAPGFGASSIHGKLGLRAQSTAELTLDQVRVPDSARLGELGEGFRIAMSALEKGRISVAAGCVGLARGCLEVATAYATQREQFGKQIAKFQLVQALLADIAVETDAARMLTWHAAALADAGRPVALAASKAKLYASEVAVRAANNALEVFGGYGYIDEYPIGKYLRDARVLTLYEGTSQIQRLIIGRALTGVSAFT
ncbi:MAG TPA: acyl-CoA dehydrogenase family protein [Sporichthya sp.]|nr:acyl-CoA dehydrogenase family protein [Sporichthya sp.]